MTDFSCENAVISLREKGYVLTDSTIELMKCGVIHKINSFSIQRKMGRIEIYNRGQYASDYPRVGMVIEGGGMTYGDSLGPKNIRVSCLDDILEHI